MAITKNAWRRYRILDRCFSNPGRKYYIQNLLDEINAALQEDDPGATGIRRRQLYYDIDFMRSANGFDAPIEKYNDGRKVYYRYDDPGFSINQRPMNEHEAGQIREALSVLSRFSGTEQFKWVNELIPKMEQAFGLKGDRKEIISFESNEFLEGIDHIEALFNAIHYERPLKISYMPYSKQDPLVFVFHPYYLKQYNNRWFLFGMKDENIESKRVTNLALDRIKGFKETDGLFIPNNIFDPADYFEDIVGVTRPDNEDPIKILLHFSATRSPYIRTKPIHGSQKRVSEDETGLTISIEVIPNNELDALVLMYGPDIKVLEPVSYQQRILEKIRQSLKNYE